MALVHRTAIPTSPQAPKDALKQALDDFRAALPVAEQEQLDAIRQNGPIEDRNVMLLTSQIDAKTKVRFSRSIAPKLMPFLNCIDAFSGVIETFVSANPQTAALVWGSVKVLLMFACNFGEYFDRLADMLRDVGETSPKLKEYGILFQSSQGLQDALTNYYTVVIRLCRKAVLAFQRHGIIHAAKTALKSFEKEFQSELDELQQRVTKCREEVSLAKSKLMVDEAKFSAIGRSSDNVFRGAMKKFSSQAAQQLSDLDRWQLESRQRQLRVDRDTVRQNLSTIDPSVAWRRVKRQCIPGTSAWFQKDKMFLQWISDDNPAVLCHVADLGRGKTTMFANVVEHLVLEEGSTASVVYLMCQVESSETLVPRNIIGCVCRQLLESVINVAEGPELEELLSKSGQSSVENLVSLVMKHAPVRTQYVLLDGIDELLPKDIPTVLNTLRNISEGIESASKTKVYLNCRSKRLFSILQIKYCMTTLLTESNVDMSEFIAITLAEKLPTCPLIMKDPELTLVIQDTIERGAKGMFLWAKLLIEHLCLLEDEVELFHALRGGQVPNELAEIYDRIIAQLDNNLVHRENIRRIFMWAAGVKRPLTVGEMQEAISIREGQTNLSLSVRSVHIENVISCCGGLVVLDNDDNTVHLVHSSLLEHLMRDTVDIEVKQLPVSGSFFQYDQKSLDKELFVLCATYLNFGEFHLSITRMNQNQGRIEMSKLSNSTADSHSNTVRTAARVRQLLQRSRQPPSKDSGVALDRIYERLRESVTSKPGSQENLVFLEYAQRLWINHTYHLHQETDIDAWGKFEKLVSAKDTHIFKPWEEKIFVKTLYSAIDTRAERFKTNVMYELILDTLPPVSEEDLCMTFIYHLLLVSEQDIRLLLWAFKNDAPNLFTFAEKSDYTSPYFISYISVKTVLLPRLILLHRLMYHSPEDSRLEMKTATYNLYRKLGRDDLFTIDGPYLVALWDLPRAFIPDRVRGYHETSITPHYKQFTINNGSAERLSPDVPDYLSVCGIKPKSSLAVQNSIGSRESSWSDFKEIGCSPISLAVICNHMSAFSRLYNKKTFDNYKEDTDLDETLELTILCCREEMFHEIVRMRRELIFSSLDKVKPHLIAQALERGLSTVALELLRITEKERVANFVDDGGNYLLMYAVEFRDVTAFRYIIASMHIFIRSALDSISRGNVSKLIDDLDITSSGGNNITHLRNHLGVSVKEYIEASLAEETGSKATLLEMQRILDDSIDD